MSKVSCIYLKFKVTIYISKNIHRLTTRLQGKYNKIELQNTFSRPFLLHKIITFQANQNLVLKFLKVLSLYCELWELRKEPSTIFMEPHRNTFKLRIRSTMPKFYCELRVFKEELPV